jgi:hypothetical protein
LADLVVDEVACSHERVAVGNGPVEKSRERIDLHLAAAPERRSAARVRRERGSSETVMQPDDRTGTDRFRQVRRHGRRPTDAVDAARHRPEQDVVVELRRVADGDAAELAARRAEEARGGAGHVLDDVLRTLELPHRLGRRLLGEVEVRPRVVAELMSRRHNRARERRVVHGAEPHDVEGRADPARVEDAQDQRRELGMRPVVEGERNVRARRVDRPDDAADTEWMVTGERRPAVSFRAVRRGELAAEIEPAAGHHAGHARATGDREESATAYLVQTNSLPPRSVPARNLAKG